MTSIGIYEKALPQFENWEDTLDLVKRLGFDFLELSIDESDEKINRLNWTKKQREELRDAIWKTGIRINTLMLSGHRRFPLGSADKNKQKKSLEILYKSIDLAVDLGIRNIQIAGYDVFYEEKSVTSRELFIKNLELGINYAAAKEVMLSVETMDDSFINSLRKVRELKEQIHSPWLQAYPDLGNITAWLQNGIDKDLEYGIDNIVSVHLKDTLPVTLNSKGKFKNVPFGDGTVDFEGCLMALHRLNYSGAFTIETWSGEEENAVKNIASIKSYFDDLIKKIWGDSRC